MKNDTVIEVRDVSKRFRLRVRGGTPTLKSAVIDWIRSRGGSGTDFYALRDVNLSVARGEVLGIIGANGAGKSTLLSLLAGTMQPTTGSIRTDGRISCLLELGAGFHPDLTGRENVFLYGAIMGIPRATMEARFEAIVDFAELRQFIDQPVKHYSSGMYVRLGFAVAVEVDPDILLIDEVLAVGDAAFRRKCLRRMEEFRERRKTMLIISHDMDTIASISDRVLFLDGGRIVELGEPREIVRHYEEHIRCQELRREWGTRDVEITRVEFLDDNDQPRDQFRWDQPVIARIHFKAHRSVENPVFGFAISTDRGVRITGNNTQIEGHRISRLQGEGRIALRLPTLLMPSGIYLFSFSVHSWDHRTNYHRLDNAFALTIEGRKGVDGVWYVPAEWRGPDPET